MNSIKTFWSPELKKERALRKDEATKMSVWKEQYRVVQEETQVRNEAPLSVCVCIYVCVTCSWHKSDHVTERSGGSFPPGKPGGLDEG